MFDRQTLIEMITVQNRLNKTMAGNAWLNSDNTTRPYYRAAWVEGAEAIGHYGYKWWKLFDRVGNIGQVKLEVVDMLHFVLSDELRSTATAYVAKAPGFEHVDLENAFDDNGLLTDGTVSFLIEQTADRIIAQGIIDIPDDITKEEESFLLITEQFVSQTLLRRSAKVRHWGAMADALNLTMTEAGLWYIGKVALNFLRDSNGQKEGNYVKLWWGVEDNVYLGTWIENAKQNGVQGDLFESISEHLAEQYRRLMAGESALQL